MDIVRLVPFLTVVNNKCGQHLAGSVLSGVLSPVMWVWKFVIWM
jgi:hypothetical protein